MKTADGLYINLHEAALIDYSLYASESGRSEPVLNHG